MFARMTINKQVKVGKTSWKTNEVLERDVDREQYNNIVSDDSLRFYRSLGSRQFVMREYTSAGYLITRLISTSPCKTMRSIYNFQLLERD